MVVVVIHKMILPKCFIIIIYSKFAYDHIRLNLCCSIIYREDGVLVENDKMSTVFFERQM